MKNFNALIVMFLMGLGISTSLHAEYSHPSGISLFSQDNVEIRFDYNVVDSRSNKPYVSAQDFLVSVLRSDLKKKMRYG